MLNVIKIIKSQFRIDKNELVHFISPYGLLNDKVNIS